MGYKYWTAEQTMELAQYLSTDRLSVIATKLGRSLDSVVSKTIRDGLSSEATACKCGKPSYRASGECEDCVLTRRQAARVRGGLAPKKTARSRLSLILTPRLRCKRCDLRFDPVRLCKAYPMFCDYCHVELECECVKGKTKHELDLHLHSVELAVGSINRDAVGPGVFIGA